MHVTDGKSDLRPKTRPPVDDENGWTTAGVSHPMTTSSADVERVIFRTNLRDFVTSVDLISSLEQGGKVSSDDCFRRIAALWDDLVRSRSMLGIERSRRPAA